MDAHQLARWTRFAAKGGIGKCSATMDCVAEQAEDLMFLKGDEITVLMQLPDSDDLYLGYCEGVVGKFHGEHVHFHAKLKKPIFTKRSSMLAAKSPTPTPRTVSPSTMPISDTSSFRHISDSVSEHRSTDDQDALPPSMSYSSSSASPDSLIITPPLNQKPQEESLSHDLNPSFTFPSPITININPTLPLVITPKRAEFPVANEDTIFLPQITPTLLHTSPENIDEVAETEDDEDDRENDNRISTAMSDGEVGIGLSLLQDIGNADGDDWSSASSRYSSSPINLYEEESTETFHGHFDATELSPSHLSNDDTQVLSSDEPPKGRQSATLSIATKQSGHSEDWDIYDDYRYSRRLSSSSKASRISYATQLSVASMPPPVPQRSRSIDSEASIYTQASAASAHNKQSLLLNVSKGRPEPLDLTDNHSPLLHTRWGSPESSHSPHSSASLLSPSYNSPLFPPSIYGPVGAATAIRQRLEGTPPPSSDNKSPVGDMGKAPENPMPEGIGIVVEDDEELPLHATNADDDSDYDDDSEHSNIPSSKEEVESILTKEISSPPYPTMELAPLPPDISPGSSQPTHVLRPSLSELRGYQSNGSSGQRMSLFLPHPNAPKPTTASEGPMYIRDPQALNRPPLPVPQGDPAMTSVNVLRMVLSSVPPRNVPHDGIVQRTGPGPTIYGKVNQDLATSMGPVPIVFSTTPPALYPQIPRPSPPVIPSPLSRANASPQPQLVSSSTPSSTAASGVIPRANFFPQAVTAPRPRSRSFSGFNAPAPNVPQFSREETVLPAISGESNSTGVPPTAPPSSASSKLPSPSLSRPASSSKLRQSHAPSPLSLAQNNIVAAGSPVGGGGGIRTPVLNFGISTTTPSSPTRPHQLRQVTSLSTLNETSFAGPAKAVSNTAAVKSSPPPSPIALRKQLSTHSVSTSTSSAHLQNISDSASAPWPRPSIETDSISLSSSRSQMVSPTPSIKPSSIKNKLSLPNLRRNQSRQGSISSQGGDGEMVQVKDMDFELVRPAIPQLHSARSSEDSLVMPRKSINDRQPDLATFLRTESPPISAPRSPTVHSDIGSQGKTSKTSGSEASMDAHRQRELKWVSLMSSVPAAQAQKSKKIRKLLLEGIPSSVRYLVWSHIMNSKGREVPGVYTQLSQRSNVPAFADIERDVKQSFSDYPQFLGARGPLLSLLQAYLTMVPDIQYTTGLTLISGHLLLLSPEEDAFWLFVSVMDAYLRPYFSTNIAQVEVDAALFSKALENNDAQVFKKLIVDMSITPNKICHPWFSTLFVGTLPAEYLNRVWDAFLSEGIPWLIRTGLAVISISRRAVLESRSEESALMILRKPNPLWLPPTPDAFIAVVMSFKLKDDEVRKQRIKMEARIKRHTQNPRTMLNTTPISLPRS